VSKSVRPKSSTAVVTTAEQLLNGILQQSRLNAQAMRNLARDIHRSSKAQLAAKDAIGVCDLLLPDQRLVVKITALLFLACYRQQFGTDAFVASRRWIEAGWCNSWAPIDALCIDTLGPMLQHQPQLYPRTATWHRSLNMWLRRASVVVLVKPVRRGLLLDEAYSVAGKLLCEPEDLVQKAVGWLLREAGKTDMDRLRSYLEKQGTRSARTTLRYAIERFPEPVRRRLLVSTRV
jgi:3-methyladenine DNA glycosylase AlkD